LEEGTLKEINVNNMSFQLDLSQPLYEQIVNQVRSAIAKGEIALGEKIPSVRELAHALQVNPNTVMRAYQELDRDQLIETRRGQGTFITTSQERVESVRKNLAKQAINEFLAKMKSLGISSEEVKAWMMEMESEER
jgi:GntR family transcriptional regulator